MNRLKNFAHIACLILLSLLASQSFGQTYSGSWEYIHHDPQFPAGSAARTHILPNGNYLSFGARAVSTITVGFATLLELDQRGRLVQAYPLPDTSVSHVSPKFQVLDNGDVIMLHSILTQAKVSYYDSSLNRLWQWTDSIYGHFRNEIAATDDGGVLISGRYQVPLASNDYRGRLTKLDSTGTIVWDSIYSADTISHAYGDIVALPGNNTGFIVADFERTPAVNSDTNYVYRYSPTGEQLWRRGLPSEYVAFNPGIPKARIEVLENGDILAATTLPPNGYGISLTKLDSSGNILRNDTFLLPPNAYLSLQDLAIFSDGSGAILSSYVGALEKPYHLHRFDAAGDTLWTRSLDYAYSPGRITYIDTTAGGGLIFSGFYNNKPWVVKLDSLGQLNQNDVYGHVFLDGNGSCTQDTLEPGLPYWTVRSHPSNKIAVTDSSGRYHLELDSGSHYLSIAPLHVPHDVNCSPTDSILVYLPNTNAVVDSMDLPISLGPLDSCPLMEVDLTSSRARSCASSRFTVNYRNQGGAMANNVSIVVRLDTGYTFTASSIPATLIGPNEYQFNIGTVMPFQFGSFTVDAMMSCSMTIGESVCSQAHIFPDTSCLPPDPNWNLASLHVQGECVPGDSVRFTVTNIGTGNMLQATGFIVVEDDILRLADSLQLNVGADTSLTFAAGGKTWFMSVDQVLAHPFRSIPRAFVEGCGRDSTGNFSRGHVVSYPQDDLGPFVSYDCREVTASLDPNDKQGFPKGIGPTHGILASDQMDYLIRFQNTGNDTAFKVVVRDRITEEYDLNTFKMVATSHTPYTVKFYPDRVVEWTFLPIALVDSATNPAGSEGFIKFSIDQVPGNPPGTELENFVDIYFDHHPAVRTNTAHHTVYERLSDLITVVEDPVPADQIPFRVYPNPFAETTKLEFPGSHFRHLQLELYDQQGRLLRTSTRLSTNAVILKRDHLPAGIYFFRIVADQQLVRSGKVMVRE